MSDDLDFSLSTSITGEQLLGGAGKLGRIAWLLKHIRRDDFFLLQDGSFSRLLFTEVVECFINGQFIATTTLAFSLIERTIAGRLSHVGETSTAKASSKELFRAALERSWITQAEFDQLDELRDLRNPIVHFKDHLAESRPEVRAAVSGRSTKDFVEGEAKRVLEAAINVLGKTAL